MSTIFSSGFNRVEDPEVNEVLDSNSIIVTQPESNVTSFGNGFNRIEEKTSTSPTFTREENTSSSLFNNGFNRTEESSETSSRVEPVAEDPIITPSVPTGSDSEPTPPQPITTEIDYEAADAETDMPVPADAAKEQMRQLMGGSLPTDEPKLRIATIAKDPNSRLAKTIKEYSETEAAFSGMAADEGMTREELYATKIFPEMEDGAMKSFFQKASEYGMGEEAFDSIVALGAGMDYTSAAYTDALDIFFTNMQQQSPEFYKEAVGATPDTAAKQAARETSNFITFLETLPVAGPVVTGLLTPMQVAGVSKKQAKELAADAKAAAAVAKERAAKFKRIETVKAAEKTTKAAKREAAREAAAGNNAIQERMIMEFEQQLGARSLLDINQVIDESKLISTKKGDSLKLDGDKYRSAGKSLLTEKGAGPDAVSDNWLMDMVKGELTGTKGELPSFMMDETGSLTVPVIRSENFDAFTAVAADILKKKGVKYDPKSGKRLIDTLFELSVDQDIMPEGELLELLNKYDLSFEEYATMMVGSASEAGKVLNKLSQITRRVKPKSEMDALKEARLLDNQSTFFKTFRRVEDIRRGLLVSQLATAMRNLSSAGVRAPLEGLQNVFDTALYNYSKDGLVAGAKSLGDMKGNWRDSFRHMKYIFDPTNYKSVKEYTDYILDRPELANQSDRMFNQINEIRRSRGAGTTDTVTDKVLSAAEKGVDVLNTPNRWQEYMIRRASFTAEMERLVKREYGLDLIDVVNKGQIQDLLNDSPQLVGEGKPPFQSIVSEAVDKALDITYAKQPEVPVFRELTSFITRNGLTTVVAFPRFMFNSMELAGEYGGGAFAPVMKRAVNAIHHRTDFKPVTDEQIKVLKGLTSKLNEVEVKLLNKKSDDLTTVDRKQLKKALNRVSLEAKGPLTKADRRQMSRNIIGATVILPAAMMYRNSEDAPSDYKTLRADDGSVINISSQSPILRQALWIAEWGKRKADGSLPKWMETQGYKEGVEAFIGTNVRTGTGGVVFQDVSDIFAEADALSGEASGKYFGKAFGEYFTTFLTPINQVIETQRATGDRPSEFVDLRKEPTMEGGFLNAFGKNVVDRFRRKGYTNLFTPSEEKKAPLRETIFQEGESEERIAPMLKVFTGVALQPDVSEAGKFLSDLGFADYKLRPRTISPGFQRYETKVLRKILPTLVDAAKSPAFINVHRKNAKKQDAMSVSKYVRLQQTSFIEDQISLYKSRIEGIIEGTDSVQGKRPDLTTPDGKPINVELTNLLATQQKFRRMKPVDRRAAIAYLPVKLKEMGMDEKPDFSNPLHLEIMLEYRTSSKIR